MGRRYIYECDGCGQSVQNTSSSKPIDWADINILAEGFTNWRSGGGKEQGCLTLLCSQCQLVLAEQINPKKWVREVSE